MKRFLLSLFIFGCTAVKAQKIESIHVNLYTDSLKKGTFNYINIDGKMPNGKFIPLDSTHLIFWSSAGKFNGNNLWIDRNSNLDKVDIKVTLRSNPALTKEFSIYIKKLPDPELRSVDDVMKGSRKKNGRRK